MSEHTTGPWQWAEISDDYFDGCVVFPQGANYGNGVAELWQGHEAWAANARLIAAAPEMLEALEGLVGGIGSAMRAIEESSLYDGECKIIEGSPLATAKAAIAKAKGRNVNPLFT